MSIYCTVLDNFRNIFITTLFFVDSKQFITVDICPVVICPEVSFIFG